MPGKRLAIDVGGTFVDFVLLDEATGEIAVEKEISDAESLPERILAGMDRLRVSLPELDMVIHGSTVVINTILQERGAPIGLITTRGFRDVLQLGRGNRPEVYNLLYRPPEALIPRYLRFEVPERLDPRGEVVTPLDEAIARQVAERLKERQVEGIAVCFLHAYANPAHERRVREIVNEVYPEAYVTISSDITREFREFERTSTTALNAYVMPRMATYLGDLERRLEKGGYQGTLDVMQSSGGMMSSGQARNIPIRTLESGPAGGVIGAAALGSQIGIPNLIAGDVGGTSFDVSLIVDGRPIEKSETSVNRRPVLQPTLDIVSIGAGGGSIAWIDEAGALRVGPQSAEAYPGPVCFGQGGTEPTVTDAHLVLGRINPENFLGRRMEIDVDLARQAIQKRIADRTGLSLQESAYGITHLANTNMINAIRRLTIERGHDPRGFALLCYGGGGGLFAGALAKELEIPRAIIPANAAVFSAWGILNADYREDVVRTRVMPTAGLTVDDLLAALAELAETCGEQLQRSGHEGEGVRLVRSADMRYVGQEHTVRVPIPSESDLREHGLALLQHRFDQLHERAYAHASPGTPTELVNMRLAAIVPLSKPNLKLIPGTSSAVPTVKARRAVFFRKAGGEVDCPIYDREDLSGGDRVVGPAIVEEWNSTVIVYPGQILEVDPHGNLAIHTG